MGLVLAIFIRTSGVVLFREGHGGNDVDQNSQQKSDSGDPDTTSVQSSLQQVTIFIDRILTGENKQIADQMSEDKSDQNKAR